MWQKPEYYALSVTWIFLSFNGSMAVESITLMDNTVIPEVRTTENIVARTIYSTIETSQPTIFPEKSPLQKTSENVNKITMVTKEYTANTNQASIPHPVSPLIHKSTYSPVATSKMVDVTSPPFSPAKDDGIYILVGAACAGFIILIVFIILSVFLYKRCGRNKYTKAKPEPNYDDEKGDISGARWVFTDGNQDWLYDGAEDDDDKQYVGPLVGKTGKRQSLMDKRYVHDSETFGGVSSLTAPKRPNLVISESAGSLEGMTFGEEENTNSQYIDDTRTDDIADNSVGNIRSSVGLEEFQPSNTDNVQSELNVQSDNDFEMNLLSKAHPNNNGIET
ncbi:uncharacterized protein LOC117124383 [Anneissia japonica]|uniref:uncharacterized protein LOC117124383 n=1 Tax=Anneissia japonica TaxID=1529436 RepID=UPI00142551BE|nr:uncharacterized protein LOC117124383 [Anneissia japonica]